RRARHARAAVRAPAAPRERRPPRRRRPGARRHDPRARRPRWRRARDRGERRRARRRPARRRTRQRRRAASAQAAARRTLRRPRVRGPPHRARRGLPRAHRAAGRAGARAGACGERAVTPTAVIVDDEPLARERLRDLVAAHPVVEIAGEAADGEAAVRLIDEIQPDIAFLDIAMPGLTGLEVLGAVRHRPLVIFTTAYDRFAVAAFELAAVDYLLKPFGAERLRAALDRAIDWLQRPAAPADERVRDTLRTDRPLERLFVRDRGRIVPLAAAA